MAKYTSVGASGLVKNGSGVLEAINLTKAGSSDSVVTLYDGVTATGSIIAVISGNTASPNSFIQGLTGANFANGIYASFAGTTLPVLQLLYQ